MGESEIGFFHFAEDMGEQPPGSELCRRDLDGDYEPSNCFWGTGAQFLAECKAMGAAGFRNIAVCERWA